MNYAIVLIPHRVELFSNDPGEEIREYLREQPTIPSGDSVGGVYTAKLLEIRLDTKSVDLPPLAA